MNAQFSLWLRDKWSRGDQDATNLASDYRATFSTEHGHRVLMHMLGETYCQVLESSTVESQNALALATLNGRRIVIHEILDNIDLAEHELIGKEDTNGN